MSRFLVVDDDNELRRNLAEILASEGYEAECVSSGEEALQKLQAVDYDIVLLDLMMPGLSGMEVLQEIRRMNSASKIIMITAFATVDNAVEAIKKGASDYIAKPFRIDELMATVRRVLEEARFEENIKGLDLDYTLSSLSNPIRRKILHLLNTRGGMRLMELTKELEIDDHTKVVFHLRTLKDSSIIRQNDKKIYTLTVEGKRTVECLDVIRTRLTG